MNTVIQPRSFDASEFLTVPRLQMHADDARWLVSTILKKNRQPRHRYMGTCQA